MGSISGSVAGRGGGGANDRAESPGAVRDPTGVAFPVVGIGASAGGLGAFEAFFSAMPTEPSPGMAFVLVQHLAPDHKCILAELVAHYTRLQVYEVEDGMTVRPDCVYIIPPNRDMALLNGVLQLMKPTEPHAQRLPIDFFFRSLAQDQHERAIGIVLSGTGSDGTLGVRAIKAEHGMTMAQTPGSTEFDGMPRSALATGLVDYELAPAAMPAKLMAYVAHAFGHGPGAAASVQTSMADNALRKIILQLRSATGHDFSHYKATNVQRRVERRMALHKVASLDGYFAFLSQAPAELEALFQDLLITTTHFFRDPTAFKALEDKVIPSLFAGKAAGEEIRVWSPGCSTGEEAYSLAILLQEHMETLRRSFPVKVFATDIGSQGIALARAGQYPAAIAADVGAERLSRWFTFEPEGQTYRIHKAIRDLVIFSEHDLIRDSPFSNLDLLSCRNLLIYLDGVQHKRLIPLFHYALNPDGFLFLGTSETIGAFEELFAVVDRKAKLYRSRERKPSARYGTPSRTVPVLGTREQAHRPAALSRPRPLQPSLAERTQQALLLHFAPAGVLVDRKGDIHFLHGQTGQFLEPTPGEAPTRNILQMARSGLRYELADSLRQAVATGEICRCQGLRVMHRGGSTCVDLTVRPLPAGPDEQQDDRMFLVVLEEVSASNRMDLEAAPSDDGQAQAEDVRFLALKRELLAKEAHLKAANEELWAFNENLKSANQEVQSMNEELQSVNEEQMTAREELQSLNEELNTVNAELQAKVADLSRALNDMNNLLAGTNIATIFVDRKLRILRFTPTAPALVNLIPSDAGRPISHLASNLIGYDRLVADIQEVLDTLGAKEIEVQTKIGRWFTLRIQPYRTLENVVEGAVITFVDVTEIHRTREALQQTQGPFRVVRDAQVAIFVHDLPGRILAWNPMAVRCYGWSEAEALGMTVRDLIPEALRWDGLAGPAWGLEVQRSQRIARSGELVEVATTTIALSHEAGDLYALATLDRPIPRPPGLPEGGAP